MNVYLYALIAASQSQIRHLLKLLEKQQVTAFITEVDAHGKELCMSAHLIVLDVFLEILP